MNATSLNPAIERPWRTYTKASIFILPAVIAWGWTCIFVVPLASQIIHRSGLNLSSFGWVYPVTFFLVNWGRVILVAGILALILLEFVALRWWRRRLAVGLGIWLANVTVLFALLMLLVMVLATTSVLAQGK
jgi:hypothetical protein